MSTPNNNNNNMKDDIAPDLPEMRSVLIRSSGPSTMMPAARTGLYAKQAPVLKTAPVLKSNNNKSTCWNPDPLPKLPEMYPLERSHAYVKDVNCAEIATRIADCLQKESIAATFEENKAVAETPCHTQFYVKLFEDHSQVIVEVQRSRGCSFTFSQCSKAILCAAKGVKRRGGPPRTFTVPASVKAAKAMDDATEEATEIAFDLMSQPRIDAQRMGLESLQKMSKDGVVKNISQDRVDKIVSLVSEEHCCRDALTVVANLLEHGSMDASKCSDEFVHALMLKLVDDDLHTAHQAARCLNYVCKALPNLKKLVSKIGVAEAQMQGLERHAKLAEQTKLLQQELEG